MTKLQNVVANQGLLTEEVKDSTEPLKRLQDLYDNIKKADGLYNAAIGMFKKVHELEHEVLEYLRDVQQEPWFQSQGDMIEAFNRFTNEESGPNWVIELSQIGQPGKIKIARSKGNYHYNKLFQIELDQKVKVKK